MEIISEVIDLNLLDNIEEIKNILKFLQDVLTYSCQLAL